MQHPVFLSYSIHDLHAAFRLRQALRAHGFSAWPDGILTPSRRAWLENYEAVIDRACCVVVFLSSTTLQSAWVHLALERARAQHTPVIPALIKGTTDHVLLARLAGEDWFDLRWNSTYDAEVREMARWIVACVRLREGVSSWRADG